MKLVFKPMEEKDLAEVKSIYDYYILHSTATYHTELLSEDELKKFIPLGNPRFVSFMIMHQNQVCGYCYLGPYKPRKAYDRTAEITIYLKKEYTGMGFGKEIMKTLEQIACEKDFRVLLGIISADNSYSIRLMEQSGFVQCAHFKQVGEKFGQVLDVLGYQKILPDPG